MFVNLFGKWSDEDVAGGHSVPVGGFVYYISPPRGLAGFVSDPLHSLVYVVFILGTCALFSKTWIEVSGSSVRDVARDLKEKDMILMGHRESGLKKILNRYIPIAATFGGMCIGALTILADFMGVIGSGIFILLFF